MKPREFGLWLYPYAVDVEKNEGINHTVLIAVPALETAWGERIAKDINTGEASNNLFNIKDTDTDSWHGEHVEIATTEYLTIYQVEDLRRRGHGVSFLDDVSYQGRRKCLIHDFFRKYYSPKESMDDFVHLIKTLDRYKEAWSLRGDPKKFCHALQAAGYATDPAYGSKLSSIVWKIDKEITREEK